MSYHSFLRPVTMRLCSLDLPFAAASLLQLAISLETFTDEIRSSEKSEGMSHVSPLVMKDHSVARALVRKNKWGCLC